MVVFVEAEPAWRTHCCLPVKYEVIHPSAVEDKPKDKWSRWRRMSWLTVSKAADRSSSERREKFPESIARRMSERISARTVSGNTLLKSDSQMLNMVGDSQHC